MSKYVYTVNHKVIPNYIKKETQTELKHHLVFYENKWKQEADRGG